VSRDRVGDNRDSSPAAFGSTRRLSCALGFNPQINPEPDAQEPAGEEYWRMTFRSANDSRKGTS
jgi:hypothetical protein